MSSSCNFIEVTREDNGEKILINTSIISCVVNNRKGSSIFETGTDDGHWRVRENLQDVKNLIYYSKADDIYQYKEIMGIEN